METTVIVLAFSLFGIFLALFSDEFREVLVKILIPSLVGISIKLAVQSRQERVSPFNAVTSIITGLGFAYLFGDAVLSYFPEKWSSVIIAAITITGEKIAYWFIYKFRVDVLADAFIEAIKNWILKK